MLKTAHKLSKDEIVAVAYSYYNLTLDSRELKGTLLDRLLAEMNLSLVCNHCGGGQCDIEAHLFSLTSLMKPEGPLLEFLLTKMDLATERDKCGSVQRDAATHRLSVASVDTAPPAAATPPAAPTVHVPSSAACPPHTSRGVPRPAPSAQLHLHPTQPLQLPQPQQVHTAHSQPQQCLQYLHSYFSAPGSLPLNSSHPVATGRPPQPHLLPPDDLMRAELEHLNRVFALTAATEWDKALALNTSFFRSLEQKNLSWEDWPRIMEWHNSNIYAIKLSANALRPLETPAAYVAGKVHQWSMKYCKEQKLCIKFQSNRCNQPGSDHTLIPSGVFLRHACCVCLMDGEGLVRSHGAAACPRIPSFQVGGGAGAPTASSTV